MKSRLLRYVPGLLLSFSMFTAQGAFVSSDFSVVIEGQVSTPSISNAEASTVYNVWLVNNSNQIAVFDDNLFISGGTHSAEINGVSVFDFDAYNDNFFTIDIDYDDGVLGSGESHYMGGGVFIFDVALLPAVSTVEITEFSIRLRNTSPLSDTGFSVFYDGAPVINTITTVPVPAVGLALLPLVVIMRLFGRDSASI